jgi:putative transcriptional regulator
MNKVKIMEQCKTINRLRVVLAEKNKTNRWLAEAIGKNEATVSRWCSNRAQPSIDVFRQIAIALNVDIKDLLNSTKDE